VACLSVGLSVKIVSPAETAEPIEMPFRLWTRVGPRNHVLDTVQIPTCEGAIFRGVFALLFFLFVVFLCIYMCVCIVFATTSW